MKYCSVQVYIHDAIITLVGFFSLIVQVLVSRRFEMKEGCGLVSVELT